MDAPEITVVLIDRPVSLTAAEWRAVLSNCAVQMRIRLELHKEQAPASALEADSEA